MSLCGLRVTVETYQAPKGSIQCKNCQRFGHTKRKCGYLLRCVASGGPHVSERKEQKRCANCKVVHTANYRGCSKWKEFRATNSERVRAAGPKTQGPNRHPTAELKAKKFPQRSPEQQTIGPGWSQASKGGRIVKTTPTGAQQSETIAQPVNVTEVPPLTPSTKHSASTTQPSDSPLATIKDLAKDIPLSSLTGVLFML